MEKLKYSRLVFVSDDMGKYREYAAILGLSDLKHSFTSVSEPQSLNIHVLVEKKIETVRQLLPSDVPFFVDHTALSIDAWKGLPGGLIKLFTGTVGCEGICKMMQGYKNDERIARAKVVIGFFYQPLLSIYFEGDVVGRIAKEPRGANNFGWDTIFIPDGETETYGEMTFTEKNRISMRMIAAKKLRQFLAGHFEL